MCVKYVRVVTVPTSSMCYWNDMIAFQEVFCCEVESTVWALPFLLAQEICRCWWYPWVSSETA